MPLLRTLSTREVAQIPQTQLGASTLNSFMEDVKVTITQVHVFQNGSETHHAAVDYDPHMQFQDFISACREKLRLPSHHKKLRFFDATGDEIYEEDFDSIDPKEPIFVSEGEDFNPASSLAIYESVHPLGEGAFGTVQLYRHRFSGLEVAIKFVPFSSMESFEDVNRVFSEVAVLRRLKHFNVVQLLDALLLPDRICLIMECCQGGELKKLIEKEGRLSEDSAYSIALQLIAGIRYCHNSYVIHRDLKLENILFADRMQMFVKIVDFGISGAFKVGAASERSDAGSLPYAAPEVINGSDNRARPSLDVWSIGCIFYYMLAGKHPFLASSLQATIDNIENARYPPLDESVSAPWRHVINGALQVRKDKRWSVMRIEEHLMKHKEDPSECQECTAGMESEPEEVKAMSPPRTVLAKTNSMKSKGPLHAVEPKKAGKKAGPKVRKTLS